MTTDRVLLIVGAGGHGRAVADAALAAGWQIEGFLDDLRPEAAWPGMSFLGRTDQLPDLLRSNPGWLVIVAVGDNSARRQLVERLQLPVDRYATIAAPSAYVSPSAIVEPGTVVMHQAVIHAGAQVGPHVIVNTAATIDHDCRIGSFCHLSPGVHLAGTVRVAEEAHIGIGANVIPGVAIGARSVVGAGAAVIRDVEPALRVAGVPALPIAQRDPAASTEKPEGT